MIRRSQQWKNKEDLGLRLQITGGENKGDKNAWGGKGRAQTHTCTHTTWERKNFSRGLVILKLPSHMTTFSDNQTSAMLSKMTCASYGKMIAEVKVEGKGNHE